MWKKQLALVLSIFGVFAYTLIPDPLALLSDLKYRKALANEPGPRTAPGPWGTQQAESSETQGTEEAPREKAEKDKAPSQPPGSPQKGKDKFYRVEGDLKPFEIDIGVRAYAEPSVMVKLNGTTERRLTLDSGASGIVIPQDVVKSLNLKRIGDADMRGFGEDIGAHKVDLVLINTLEIGGLKVNHVPARAMLSNLRMDGVVGLPVIGRFGVVELNFKKGKLKFTPHDRTSREKDPTESTSSQKHIPLDTQDSQWLPYTQQAKEQIDKAFRYPQEAEPGLKGVVELSFVVERDGNISQVEVLNSSGHPILDRAMTEAIQQASPLQPLPPHVNQESVRFGGKFKFNMYSHLILDAWLNDHPCKAMVDTGAFATIISRSFLERIGVGVRPPMDPREVIGRVYGFSGSSSNWWVIGQRARLKIGDRELPVVPFRRDRSLSGMALALDPAASASMSLGVDIVLGMPHLKDLILIVDYRNDRVTLKPAD
ncbi:MAG: TonB family protein [Candidatus Tectomicrobia bacterium]|uniref:TonB family protein n=1 Tax=Tectimicrobiota bacterium TaxID=2528274 RepID=A0A932G0V4_UNCTE|nr:TonB family protein [Candidatus Tectomicrobia bacterium]